MFSQFSFTKKKFSDRNTFLFKCLRWNGGYEKIRYVKIFDITSNSIKYFSLHTDISDIFTMMFNPPSPHTHTPGLLLFTALDPLTLLSCYDPLLYSCLALREVKEQPGTVGDELRDEVHPQKFSPQNWGGNERWVTRTIDVKKSNFSKDKKYHTHSLTRMWPPPCEHLTRVMVSSLTLSRGILPWWAVC